MTDLGEADPSDRKSAVGLREGPFARCRRDKIPPHQKHADIERRARYAMRDGHHHRQHRPVDLQMRREWALVLQAHAG
jgi:hypothetical protein